MADVYEPHSAAIPEVQDSTPAEDPAGPTTGISGIKKVVTQANQAAELHAKQRVKNPKQATISFSAIGESNELQPADHGHFDVQFIHSLLFNHSMMSEIDERVLEAKAYLYALLDVMAKKGLITPTEIEERYTFFETALKKKAQQDEFGFKLRDDGIDKYQAETRTVTINCEERYHLCHAACCSLVFPLSRQDMEEGIIKWDLGRPYMIRQNTDGYCTHIDRPSLRCSVHANRPLVCREYDCRDDKRIWEDFEKMIPSEALKHAYRGPSTLPVVSTNAPTWNRKAQIVSEEIKNQESNS